MNKRTGACK